MSPPIWPSLPQLWTRQQRGVLIGFLLVLSALFTIRLIHNNQTVPPDLPDVGPRAGEVMSQLDLNTADAASLSAIPRLGAAKAQAIVAYRQQYLAAHPGKRAFDRMEALYRVKGIGVATMETMKQYTFITPAKTPGNSTSRP
jgi:competence ComEA-like helix-hairpin-helix protein